MFLITSAALVAQELQSEFGAIVPVCLPVGNKPLLRHQLTRVPTDERVVLSLPKGYRLSATDYAFLEQQQVELVYLPLGLSLGEAILYALNLSPCREGESLSILHGDTLLEEFASGKDVVGISEVEDAYDWAVYQPGTEQLLSNEGNAGVREWVANGYFGFTEPREFVRHLIESQFHFIDAINRYHRARPMAVLKTQRWLDFGHIHTFYRSKTAMTTQRSFNQMKIDAQVVTKRSEKSIKMRAEANWLATLPPELKPFTPQLISVLDSEQDGVEGYQIEYKHLTALNELFVFGRLPPFVWRRILNACVSFIDGCRQHRPNADTLSASLPSLLSQKTDLRLQQWQQQSGLDLNRPWQLNGETVPAIAEILERVQPHLPQGLGASWYHGDLCFSNILYDFRTSNIKVIDPRGMTTDAKITPYGDVTYDIAKLSHSVIGRYDAIIAGYFSLDWQEHRIQLSLDHNDLGDVVERYFCQLMEQRFGFSQNQLLALQIHLFLSMLPLHNDNPLRQQALFANALRLFLRLDALS